MIQANQYEQRQFQWFSFTHWTSTVHTANLNPQHRASILKVHKHHCPCCSLIYCLIQCLFLITAPTSLQANDIVSTLDMLKIRQEPVLYFLDNYHIPPVSACSHLLQLFHKCLVSCYWSEGCQTAHHKLTNGRPRAIFTVSCGTTPQLWKWLRM